MPDSLSSKSGPGVDGFLRILQPCYSIIAADLLSYLLAFKTRTNCYADVNQDGINT